MNITVNAILNSVGNLVKLCFTLVPMYIFCGDQCLQCYTLPVITFKENHQPSQYLEKNKVLQAG